MKRIFLILFLSFSVVTFFANKKSEALPDLTLDTISTLKTVLRQE